MATFKDEFPDFAPEAMPLPMPQGFQDRSWKNDACPSFHNAALALTLWVDFAGPEQREYQDGTRFAVSNENPDTGNADTFFESDDWSAILCVVAFAAAGFAHENRSDI